MADIMSEDKITKDEEDIDFVILGPSQNIEAELKDRENPTESYFNLKYRSNSSECSVSHPDDPKFSKLRAIRSTIDSLEKSLRLSRDLETEQTSRYLMLKTRNLNLSDELKDADKRNKNMLNLFRRNVTDFGLEDIDDLPRNLKIEVQRTWHHKYDAMLKLTEQLKEEISVKDATLREKSVEIDALEKRLLNLAENLIQREETLKNVCTKYLNLKKRKDEQEILLRGSIETLQDALQKASCNLNPIKSCMSLIPSKEALLAREMRRSDRLARENLILRGLLQEARNGCTCTLETPRSCSSTSLVEKMT